MNNMTDEMSNFKGKQVNYDASYESSKKVIGLGQDLIKEDGALRHRAPAAPAVAPTLEPIEPAYKDRVNKIKETLLFWK